MKTQKHLYHQIHQWSLLTSSERKPRQRQPRQKNHITTTDIMHFFRQLSTLLTAGVSLTQSCDIMLTTQTKHVMQSLIHSLKSQLANGVSFTQALQHHPTHFDDFTCQLVYLGEHSGELDSMLSRIAHHHENHYRIKKKIRQALIYPMFVLLSSLAIVFCLMVFVVPRFADMFLQFHSQLPLLTQCIIQLANTIKHDSGWISLILFFCCCVGYRIRHLPLIQRMRSYFQLTLPLLGHLTRLTYYGRFTRSLSTLLSAGIPLLDALKMMANINKNHIFVTVLRRIKNTIETGQPFYLALQQANFFPPLLIQMIKIGEESGNIESMMEKSALQFEQETEEWLQTLSQLLEPLIIMILGVLIGGIVIAMYLPIFQLGTLI